MFPSLSCRKMRCQDFLRRRRSAFPTSAAFFCARNSWSVVASLALVTLALVTLALLGGPVVAAPFQPNHIPSDAKWLVHVDMEAFRATAGGRMCREHCLSRDDVRRHLERMREEIGMDPSEDLLSMTVYDTQFQREHGVALVRVKNVDGSRLIAKLNEKEPHNRKLEYKKHELYLWTKKRRGEEITVCGTLWENQIMVFSRDPLKAIKAIDVLNGDASGLDAESRLAGNVAAGTVVLMRGVDLASAVTKINCPVLKESAWMEVAMGAANGKSFAHMAVEAKTAETAKNAQDVINGFVALARLKHDKHPRIGLLLQGLNVQVSGANLDVDWSADESDVVKSIEEVVAHKKKHHRK